MQVKVSTAEWEKKLKKGQAYELSDTGRKLRILKVVDILEEDGGRCDATQDDAWAEGADLAHAESFC